MDSKLLNVVEEQVAVQFTGKVNVLSTYNRQFLGQIFFKNGDVIQVTFQKHKGLKAFYQILIDEYSLQSFEYVVEPELVDESERKIHYPYGVIKNKLSDVLKLHRDSLKLRPPENIKILLDPEFLEDSLEVTPKEFDVLATLTDWNNTHDLYDNCELLDHEITLALVSLRKKGALKILAPRQG